MIISLFLCPRKDSNLHASRHTHLKRARLPIPPLGLFAVAKVVIIFKLAIVFVKNHQKNASIAIFCLYNWRCWQEK